MKKLSLFCACTALLILLSGTLLDALPGQQMARLRVTLAAESTVESAQIFVNGQAKGTVYRGRASEFILPFSQRATVRLVHGASVVERQVNLVPGRWVEISIPVVTQTKGTIRVQLDAGPDNAQVFVDNAFKGTVNRGQSLVLPNIDAGTRQVRVQNGSAQQTRAVTVTPGQLASVNFSLQVVPVTGEVSVRLDPTSAVATASVLIDGTKRATILKGRALSFTLAAGNHTIRLEQGNLFKDLTVSLSAGQKMDANFILTEPEGSLRFVLERGRTSRVSTARVDINGARKATVVPGRTYLWNLPAGQHTVRVQSGAVEATETVTIIAGQTTPLTMTLRPPMGRLSVTHGSDSSVYTATLFINGASRTTINKGATMAFDLEPGTYTVQLKNGALESESVPITLASGQNLSASLTVKKPMGKVNLTYSGESAHAWATIYIDGNQSDRIRRGQTKSYELETGFHTFEVRAGNEKAEERIMLSQRRERNLTLKIEPTMGRLAVTLGGDSNVPNAQVTVNGQSRGTVNRGQTLTIENLAPGTVAVVLSGNGITEQGQAQITRGQTASISLSLKQQMGSLLVTLLPGSRAAFARVVIDGVYRFTVNRGESKTLELPAGVHTVILEGGRAPQTIRQVVETGKVSRIVMNLQ
ncbi:MAG TPA: hypothetical protein PLD82_02815 [Spirochaetota bacterium]|nr:hypothetical protein [Spirochaetota bacterium]